MFALILLIKHFELFKPNVPMSVFIHEFENSLHLVKRQLYSQVLDALCEFVEGQRELVIGVESSEAGQ